MVPSVDRLWWRCLVFTAILWPLNSQVFAGEFVFADSFAAGKQQVAQTDKLLVVIQATGDFTGPVFNLSAVETFHRVTLQDAIVSNASRGRCVFVCQPIGPPTPDDGDERRRDVANRPPIANVVTYYCSADGLVLHFLVGFIGPEELVGGLSWAERVQRESQLKRHLAERRNVVAGWHRIRIADSQAISLLPSTGDKKSSGESSELSTEQLRTLVGAAWEIRGRQLLARFGDNFPVKDRDALLQELAQHGEPRTDFPHLVLAQQPLVPLSRLQRPVAQVCLRSEFWEISPRREELAEWVYKQRYTGRSVLLVISSNAELEPLARRKLTEVSWRPNSAPLIPLIQQSVVLQITASELVTLWQDLRLDSKLLAGRRAPRFVVLDTASAVSAVLDDKNDEGDLARVLAGAVSLP